MFFIFNKDKAISYIVTVFTVAILFLTASAFSNSRETVQTSVNESSNEMININENKDNSIDNNIVENIN